MKRPVSVGLVALYVRLVFTHLPLVPPGSSLVPLDLTKMTKRELQKYTGLMGAAGLIELNEHKKLCLVLPFSLAQNIFTDH